MFNSSMFKVYKFRRSGGFTFLLERVVSTRGIRLRGDSPSDVVAGVAAVAANCGPGSISGICSLGRVFNTGIVCGTGTELVMGLVSACGTAMGCCLLWDTACAVTTKAARFRRCLPFSVLTR